jgi:hypothetical protein
MLKNKSMKAAVIISDLHAGCQLGLCPPKVRLDEGGEYIPNEIQEILYEYWLEFWDIHVPEMTNGLPYYIIVNGDTIDGVHHGATHQISHNLTDQANIAMDLLKPLKEKCEGRFYMIRGTEAHTAPSSQEEERLAKELESIPNKFGQYARNELWKKIGDHIIHVLHHIGSTNSQSYESTAVHGELVAAYTEAARWGEQPPDIVVRSHRHRYFETVIATKNGRGRGIVTPGWQAKTPFSYRIGARNQRPQFGGIVIIESPGGELYTRSKVWSLGREEVE